ncbi:hypothetical protein [Roseivivax sp. CAU 1761]
MRKITHYTVVAATYDVNLERAVLHNRLESQVNEKIQQGWQPFGALVGVRGEGNVIFTQPMVRYAE